MNRGSLRVFLPFYLALLLAGCSSKKPLPLAPHFWIVDDGERIARSDGDQPLARGDGNAVWSPGNAAQLFGLPSETVAFQVVVTADKNGLSSIEVEISGLAGVAVERFVVHELSIVRRSGGKTRGESLGWERGAMPPLSTLNPSATTIPDVLIPVSPRRQGPPAIADYPMTVAPYEHRVVFVDLTLGPSQPAGTQQGTVLIKSNGALLSQIPLVLQVGTTRLPYAAAKTMVFYDPEEIHSRMEDKDAVINYLQLLHRHHLSPFFRINNLADFQEQEAELRGTAYTREAGYNGPGQGVPSDLVSLGSYGSLKQPTPEKLRELSLLAKALAKLPKSAEREVFLYVADEDCDTPLLSAWREALAQSGDPLLVGLRLSLTCSRPFREQKADVVMVGAGSFDDSFVEESANLKGSPRRLWIYNGYLPRTGAFLTDGGALSLRVNPWLQYLWGVDRWFYWESTFWNDNNRGGHGPYDPLVQAETFHNHQGDHANGDGVLVYPGRQKPPFVDLGYPGILPSYRLKQWRRGIQDVGYLQLVAQTKDGRDLALREARGLVGAKSPLYWAQKGGSAAWVSARRRLFDFLQTMALRPAGKP